MDTWAFYAAGSFVVASFWALKGTNAQAAMAEANLAADENPPLSEAGQVWTPSRWVCSPATRRRRRVVEYRLRGDPVLWARYNRLVRELRAWNLLESSVAIALPASVIAFVQVVMAR